MKLYKNEWSSPLKNPEDEGFSPVKDIPNAFLQVIAIVASSFVLLGIVVLLKKMAFGLPVRSKFNPDLDIDIPLILLAILITLVARVILRFFSFIGKGFPKDIAIGYRLKSLSFYIEIERPISKLRRIISLITPFILITLASLTIIKLKQNYGTYLYLYILYGNTILSAQDLYDTVRVLMTPKDAKTIVSSTKLYYKTEKTVSEEETSEN